MKHKFFSRKRSMALLFIIALLVFVISAPSAIKHILEFSYSYIFSSKYSLQTQYYLKAKINSVNVEIRTLLGDERVTFIGGRDFERTSFPLGTIMIMADGNEITRLTDVPINIQETEHLRTTKLTHMSLVKENWTNEQYLAIVINRNLYDYDNGTFSIRDIREQEFEMYKIYGDGSIIRDEFSYSNRDMLQTSLARWVTFTPLQHFLTKDYYPSLFYPIIFPILPFIISLILLLIALPAIRHIRG